MTRGTALVAGVLFVALLAAIPAAFFLHQPYLLSLFSRLAILAIAATGLNLVLGHAGLPAFGHAAFVASNLARSVWMGLTRAFFVVAPGDVHVHRYYQQLTRLSSAFALVSDMAMFVKISS